MRNEIRTEVMNGGNWRPDPSKPSQPCNAVDHKNKTKKNSELPSIFPSRKLPLHQTPATEAEGYFEVYRSEIIC